MIGCNLLLAYLLFYYFRNALLEEKGLKPPKAYKTGTTIAGVIFKVRFGDFK